MFLHGTFVWVKKVRLNKIELKSCDIHENNSGKIKFKCKTHKK